MRKSEIWQLALIGVVALVAVYVVIDVQRPGWVNNLAFWQPEGRREIALRLGLDLQGGLQVLLAADVPDGQELDPTSMETARRIVESRVNSLGLTEPLVQAQGDRRIIVELPGIDNPDQAVETIKGTALLEFANAGTLPLAPGTLVTTSLGGPSLGQSGATPDIVTGDTVTDTTTSDVVPVETRTLETVLTGASLENVGLNIDDQNNYIVPFELDSEGAQIFAEYTASHVGQYLCIVLDKEVISCPRVDSAIPGGEAMIRGDFSYDTARQLAIQLQYGALPVPLKVESFNRIGATLGAESVDKSVRAGAIGLGVVFLFMLIYYRLPGALADLGLIIYVLLNIALYKLAPITLKRMKEELRRGRGLFTAIEIGFSRAWPSIRDAQISTLIICAILFVFGTNLGASIVKGFAMTLAVGTVINIFTAVFATRTFVRQVAASASRCDSASTSSVAVSLYSHLRAQLARMLFGMYSTATAWTPPSSNRWARSRRIRGRFVHAR